MHNKWWAACKKNEKLKEKLASSQDAYKSLLTQMETMCKHYDKLTNKVDNLEAVGTTPTKAFKKKSFIFDKPKKDASTSCNVLCLDSPLCNQVCRYMHTRGHNGEWATQARSGSPHQGLDSSERQDGASPTLSR